LLLQSHLQLLDLRGSAANTVVNLYAARIDGDLDCRGASFKNAQGLAFDARLAKIGGGVVLRDGFNAAAPSLTAPPAFLGRFPRFLGSEGELHVLRPHRLRLGHSRYQPFRGIPIRFRYKLLSKNP